MSKRVKVTVYIYNVRTSIELCLMNMAEQDIAKRVKVTVLYILCPHVHRVASDERGRTGHNQKSESDRPVYIMSTRP